MCYCKNRVIRAAPLASLEAARAAEKLLVEKEKEMAIVPKSPSPSKSRAPSSGLPVNQDTVLTICWKRYLQRLEKRPLQTKALTSAAMGAVSDIIAQRLASQAPFNWRRTLAVALYGFLWSGPSNHYWQLLLERLIPATKPAADAPRRKPCAGQVDVAECLRIFKKVALDQFTYGPLNNVIFMVFIGSCVEGRSWRSVASKVVSGYPTVQSKGWRVWPAAQLVNQAFVPMKLRVLWTNAVALAWSTFLITSAKAAHSRLPTLAEVRAR